MIYDSPLKHSLDETNAVLMCRLGALNHRNDSKMHSLRSLLFGQHELLEPYIHYRWFKLICFTHWRFTAHLQKAFHVNVYDSVENGICKRKNLRRTCRSSNSSCFSCYYFTLQGYYFCEGSHFSFWVWCRDDILPKQKVTLSHVPFGQLTSTLNPSRENCSIKFQLSLAASWLQLLAKTLSNDF